MFVLNKDKAENTPNTFPTKARSNYEINIDNLQIEGNLIVVISLIPFTI